MPPIARGQTWLFQPLQVSTVPNTGRNQSDSRYRGLDEEVLRLQKLSFASKLNNDVNVSDLLSGCDVYLVEILTAFRYLSLRG